MINRNGSSRLSVTDANADALAVFRPAGRATLAPFRLRAAATVLATGIIVLGAAALASFWSDDAPAGPDAAATTPTAAMPEPQPVTRQDEPQALAGGVMSRPTAVDASFDATEPAAEDPAPLSADDPRWAVTERQPANEGGDAETSTRADDHALALAATSRKAEPVRIEAADAPDTPDEAVAVARTENEAIALEEAQREETSGVDREATAAIAGPAGEADSSLFPATVTRYVNLRAGPADEAEVLMVVPANAAIEAETDCNWCAVAYDGKRGYIYKSFISR